MNQYFQKNKPNVQRDVQKKCMICTKEFRFGRSEHQCKRCLRAVCSDCSIQKVMIFKQGFTRFTHRCCKLCFEQINALKEYITTNKIAFGRMSTVGQKWLKKIEKNISFIPSQTPILNEFKRQVFSRMWDAYNYSVRQFIGMLTFEKRQEEIYEAIYTVIKAVFSVFPKQDLQSVVFLSILILCFSSPDKATLICLHLIQLKALVFDSDALIQTYLKALGIHQQARLQQYIRYIRYKYISSISVNYANINSSIYLIDKIINRRKVDQLYIFLCLSADLVKDPIVKSKEDFTVINLLLVRHCTSNSTSPKYRQVSSVKSSSFMKEEKDQIGSHLHNKTSTDLFDGRVNTKSNGLNSSFNQGVKMFTDSPTLLKKNTIEVVSDNRQFQKKYGQFEDQFVDDSISMISMIQEMKDLNRDNPEPSDGRQILTLLGGKEFKNSNDSDYMKSFKTFSDDKVDSPTRAILTKQMKKAENCQNCQVYINQIQSLKKQLQQYYRIADTAQCLKEQNQQLKDKIKKLEKQTIFKDTKQASTRESLIVMEKAELEAQLRRFKQSLTEYQYKQKEFQSTSIKYEQTKKTLKKQQGQIKSLQLQLDQSAMTIKMLKNRLQNQALQASNPSQRQSDSTDTSTSQSKMIEILKQNLKQKNTQMEELTKKNKLLIYQLQQMGKSNKEGKDQQNVKSRLEKSQSEKEGIIKKLKEITMVLMNEEGQKLRLSEQNFTLRQILRENGVKFDV